MREKGNAGSREDWLDFLRVFLDAPPEFNILVKNGEIIHAGSGLAADLGYAGFAELRSAGGFERLSPKVEETPVSERELVERMVSATDGELGLSLEKRGTRNSFRYSAKSRPLPEEGAYLIVLYGLDSTPEDIPIIDEATGAFSSMAMVDKIREELAHLDSERHPVSSALVLISLDRMGSLLDEHGLHARDSIHRELARVIQNNIRITDRLGRWDGDRFIVLAGAGSDLRRAKRVAERLRRKIEGGDFPGINASITASMAVTELNRGDSMDSLARRLQNGIDAALARGGNRVELATAKGKE